MDSRFFLFLMLGAASAFPSQAASGLGIFGKRPVKNPAERVPELILLLKSSGDENKRADAAAELRQFDVATYPDILTTLIQALNNDAKPSVRAEAAASLGKIRPVSITVGQALEKSLAQDLSMRVRIQARSSLLQYNLAGYRSPPKNPTSLEGKEPPLAAPFPALPTPKSIPVNSPGKKPAAREPGGNPFFSIPNLFKLGTKAEETAKPAREKTSPPAPKGKSEGPDLFPK
ncbi:MAG: HEAT repeat domain-containing protein [Gemmataceae bacterium]|nr:HEAT repeat domain-containing protein [Gemmataceae bacterium]